MSPSLGREQAAQMGRPRTGRAGGASVSHLPAELPRSAFGVRYSPQHLVLWSAEMESSDMAGHILQSAFMDPFCIVSFCSASMPGET